MGYSKLFYRVGYTTKVIDGIDRGFDTTPKVHGLCLCWGFGYYKAKNHYGLAKLVHRGSAHGGSGLFVRHKGIDYEVAKETENERCIWDDCGRFIDISSDFTITDDGYHFDGNRGIARSTNEFDIDILQPWTVNVKFKANRSKIGSANKGNTLFWLTDGSNTNPSMKKAESNVFGFYFPTSSKVNFQDHFQGVSLAVDSSWQDFKITFYPTGRIEYNGTIKDDVYVVNYTITKNDVVKTGTTYYVDTSRWHTFSFALGRDGFSTGSGAVNVITGSLPFYGDIRYFSISQDDQGYSVYRRPTHKVLLHFD